MLKCFSPGRQPPLETRDEAGSPVSAGPPSSGLRAHSQLVRKRLLRHVFTFKIPEDLF